MLLTLLVTQARRRGAERRPSWPPTCATRRWAEAAADGAVHAAAFHLLSPADGWAADGRLRTLAVPGASVSLRIADEGGKVNPNLASRELLRAMLRQLDMTTEGADALAGNIVAWRFPSAGGGFTVPGLGAGAVAADPPLLQQYRAAGRDYAPPGAPFESLDELGLVLGMTPVVLERLRPHLSLLNDTEPDPALASPLVLRALSASQPGARVAARPPQPPRAVVVVAEAVTGTGARFTRRAGLRLGRSEKDPPVSIANWDTAQGVQGP